MDELIELSSEMSDLLPFATILIKRGNSIPSSEDLLDGELGYSRGRRTLYIKDSSFINVMIPEEQREEGKDYTGIIPIGSYTSGGGGSGEGGGGSISLDYTVSIPGMAPDASAVRKLLGKLEDLETTDRSNLVAAINEALNNAKVEVDEFLTKEGVAAEAKAVGDAIAKIEDDLEKAVETLQTNIDGITIEVDDTLTQEGKAADAAAVREAIDKSISDAFDAYKEEQDYVNNPLAIKSFTISPNKLERGRLIDTVTLSWQLSRKPTQLTVGKTNIDSLSVSGNITEKANEYDESYSNFPTNQSWKIFAKDSKKEVEKTVQIKYVLPWYSGSALEPESYDYNFIRQFSKSDLNPDQSIIADKTESLGSFISSFKYVSSTDGKYIYYCCPKGKSYSFFKGTSPFIMNPVAEVDYINWYNENLGKYVIYRTDYPNIGDFPAGITVLEA